MRAETGQFGPFLRILQELQDFRIFPVNLDMMRLLCVCHGTLYIYIYIFGSRRCVFAEDLENLRHGWAPLSRDTIQTLKGRTVEDP